MTMRIVVISGLCLFLSALSLAVGAKEPKTQFELSPESLNLIVEPPAIQTQARCVPTQIVNASDCLKFKGYRCLQILEESPYARAGMKDGDVIFEINGKPAENPVTFMQAFGENSKKVINFKICRHDKVIALKFKK